MKNTGKPFSHVQRSAFHAPSDSRDHGKFQTVCTLPMLLHTALGKSARKVRFLRTTSARWPRSINFGLILTGFHFRLAVFTPSHREMRRENNWKSVAGGDVQSVAKERTARIEQIRAKIDDLSRESADFWRC